MPPPPLPIRKDFRLPCVRFATEEGWIYVRCREKLSNAGKVSQGSFFPEGQESFNEIKKIRGFVLLASC